MTKGSAKDREREETAVLQETQRCWGHLGVDAITVLNTSLYVKEQVFPQKCTLILAGDFFQKNKRDAGENPRRSLRRREANSSQL